MAEREKKQGAWVLSAKIPLSGKNRFSERWLRFIPVAVVISLKNQKGGARKLPAQTCK